MSVPLCVCTAEEDEAKKYECRAYVRFLSSIIVAPFYPNNVIFTAKPGYLAVVTVLTAVILFFGYRLFKGLIRNAFSTLSNKSILIMCIMPAAFFILINIYSSVFLSATEAPRSTKMLVNLSIMVVGLISYYINIRMVLDTAKNIQAERRLSEEKTLLESLNRTKSEFFGNISHEMKTPLTIIATDIQLAEQFLNDGNIDGAKELMREAWQETMQTADLVTDALVLSRGQEVIKPMGDFNFGVIIEATLTVFADRRTALEIATHMVLKAGREGGFCLNAAGREFPFPGFFYGEAGVLYSLIRLLSPEIPSLI